MTVPSIESIAPRPCPVRVPPRGFDRCDLCGGDAERSGGRSCFACAGTGWVRVGSAVVRRTCATVGDLVALTLHAGDEPGEPATVWECITIVRSGFVRYERRDHDQRAVMTGQVDSARARSVFRTLDLSTFPYMPRHPIVPGQTLVLRTDHPLPVLHAEVQCSLEVGRNLPGYANVQASLRGIMAACQGDRSRRLAWGLRELMTAMTA